MRKRHVNESLRTAFAGTGKLAGIGVDEKDYSEESYPDRNPLVVYKLSEEELKKYRDGVSGK